MSAAIVRLAAWHTLLTSRAGIVVLKAAAVLLLLLALTVASVAVGAPWWVGGAATGGLVVAWRIRIRRRQAGTVSLARPTVLYRLLDDQGGLLYVGITSRKPHHRLAEHRDNQPWREEIATMVVDPTRHTTRRSALTAELRAIATERPRHNLSRGSRHDATSRRQDAASRLAKRTTITPDGWTVVRHRWGAREESMSRQEWRRQQRRHAGQGAKR